MNWPIWRYDQDNMRLHATFVNGGSIGYVELCEEIVAITVAADDLDRDVATKYTKLEEKIQSLLYGPSDNMTEGFVVGLSEE
ncbi:hypothetical protein DPMN_028444 [Dreissena polymorpha]|uniref:Uncharacterized protein n=1 Tax=Dreissena polymorpha TaxID=45954 RepID=A0A9D4LWA9_DREPO|nr:hypothetical protein DPMN_028444 [Dreissena polymorpha]